MKKILTIVIAMLAIITSCTKESRLQGSWKLDSLTMSSGKESGLHLSAEEMGINVILTFKSGGVVEITAEGETHSSNYTADKDHIIIDGEAIQYSIKGKYLTVYYNDNTDLFEGNTTLTFKKI